MVKCAINLTVCQIFLLTIPINMEENIWLKKILPALTQLLTQTVIL